ncbi:N-acetyltransferase [bacterium]|nr:MAG: N-acetyltransferase [bacterium]
MTIQQWKGEDPPPLGSLRAEAKDEGFRFLDRLIDQWEVGLVRFEHPGETYFLVLEDGRPIACGGVATDPYTLEAGVGRIRALYVSPASRRRGIGNRLLREIEAETSFMRLRLRTEEGAAFYEANGYLPSDEPKTTHGKRLNPPSSNAL